MFLHEAFREALRDRIFAVIDEDDLRLLLESVHPVQQPVFIRMAADIRQVGDLCVHLDLLAEELHALRPLVEHAPQRPLRLIACKEDQALLPPQVVF